MILRFRCEGILLAHPEGENLLQNLEDRLYKYLQNIYCKLEIVDLFTYVARSRPYWQQLFESLPRHV